MARASVCRAGSEASRASAGGVGPILASSKHPLHLAGRAGSPQRGEVEPHNASSAHRLARRVESRVTDTCSEPRRANSLCSAQCLDHELRVSHSGEGTRTRSAAWQPPAADPAMQSSGGGSAERARPSTLGSSSLRAALGRSGRPSRPTPLASAGYGQGLATADGVFGRRPASSPYDRPATVGRPRAATASALLPSTSSLGSMTRRGQRKVPGGRMPGAERFTDLDASARAPSVRGTLRRSRTTSGGGRRSGEPDARRVPEGAMTLRVNPPTGAFTLEASLLNAPRVILGRARRELGEPIPDTPSAGKYLPKVGSVGTEQVPISSMRSLRSSSFAHSSRTAPFPGQSPPPSGPGPKYQPNMPGDKPRSKSTRFGAAHRFHDERPTAPGPISFEDVRRHSPAFGFGGAPRF